MCVCDEIQYIVCVCVCVCACVCVCFWRVVPDVFVEGCSGCVCGGLFLTCFWRVVPDVFVEGCSWCVLWRVVPSTVCGGLFLICLWRVVPDMFVEGCSTRVCGWSEWWAPARWERCRWTVRHIERLTCRLTYRAVRPGSEPNYGLCAAIYM